MKVAFFCLLSLATTLGLLTLDAWPAPSFPTFYYNVNGSSVLSSSSVLDCKGNSNATCPVGAERFQVSGNATQILGGSRDIITYVTQNSSTATVTITDTFEIAVGVDTAMAVFLQYDGNDNSAENAYSLGGYLGAGVDLTRGSNAFLIPYLGSRTNSTTTIVVYNGYGAGATSASSTITLTEAVNNGSGVLIPVPFSSFGKKMNWRAITAIEITFSNTTNLDLKIGPIVFGRSANFHPICTSTNGTGRTGSFATIEPTDPSMVECFDLMANVSLEAHQTLQSYSFTPLNGTYTARPGGFTVTWNVCPSHIGLSYNVTWTTTDSGTLTPSVTWGDPNGYYFEHVDYMSCLACPYPPKADETSSPPAIDLTRTSFSESGELHVTWDWNTTLGRNMSLHQLSPIACDSAVVQPWVEDVNDQCVSSLSVTYSWSQIEQSCPSNIRTVHGVEYITKWIVFDIGYTEPIEIPDGAEGSTIDRYIRGKYPLGIQTNPNVSLSFDVQICDNAGCPSDQCHAPGTCTAEGTCVGAPLSGSNCDDQLLCTLNDTCQTGVCTGTPKVCPTSTNQCTYFECDPATGGCVERNLADGTGCDDGNLCTSSDFCRNGTCTSGHATTCVASDGCHQVGVCDPSTGQCSNPVAPNGVACDDGNACSISDVCNAGVCVAETYNECISPDQCHSTGTCEPTDGTCTYPPLNGTACEDGNPCTYSDVCSNGMCIAGISDSECTIGPCSNCSAIDSCHRSSCNPQTGQCTQIPLNGTTCNDGNLCTGFDMCLSGTCTGFQPHICPPSANQCEMPTSCNASTGRCSYINKPDATPCNDGNLCTTGDTCQSGICGGSAVECDAADQCHTAGICNPSTGVCSQPIKANGSPCNDGSNCTQTDVCMEGTCSGETIQCPTGWCNLPNSCVNGYCPIPCEGIPFPNINAAIISQVITNEKPYRIVFATYTGSNLYVTSVVPISLPYGYNYTLQADRGRDSKVNQMQTQYWILDYNPEGNDCSLDGGYSFNVTTNGTWAAITLRIRSQNTCAQLINNSMVIDVSGSASPGRESAATSFPQNSTIYFTITVHNGFPIASITTNSLKVNGGSLPSSYLKIEASVGNTIYLNFVATSELFTVGANTVSLDLHIEFANSRKRSSSVDFLHTYVILIKAPVKDTLPSPPPVVGGELATVEVTSSTSSTPWVIIGVVSALLVLVILVVVVVVVRLRWVISAKIPLPDMLKRHQAIMKQHN